MRRQFKRPEIVLGLAVALALSLVMIVPTMAATPPGANTNNVEMSLAGIPVSQKAGGNVSYYMTVSNPSSLPSISADAQNLTVMFYPAQADGTPSASGTVVGTISYLAVNATPVFIGPLIYPMALNPGVTAAISRAVLTGTVLLGPSGLPLTIEKFVSIALIDARISIAQNATNPAGTAHNFTVTVEKNQGAGWIPASGVSVNASLTGVGSIMSANPATTDVNGHVTFTVNSAVAGTATVHASGTVGVNGINIHVATDGYGAYNVSNEKTWVGAKIVISPQEGTNRVGESHNLTACVYVDTGSGYGPYTEPITINFTKTEGVGSLNATSVPTSTGCAQVTLTTAEAGNSTVSAQAAFSVDGAVFNISTDGTGDNSDPAEKDWVKAKIEINPQQGTNEVGESHNLTACVYVDTGSGYGPYTEPITINFTKTEGVGSLNATSVPTSAGCAQVTLTTAEAGNSTVSAQAAFSVDGVAFDISTNGTGDNSGPAQKTWGCAGEIEILKKNGAGAPLAGACFNITPSPYGGGTFNVCDGDPTFDKDGNDGVILLADVPCGNYTVTEDAAPQGYVAVTGSQNVTVTSGSRETVEFINTPCVGSVEILKRDDAGAPLAGACFNVTPNPYGSGTLTVCDDDGNDADTATTGRILLANVPPDGYDIVEVQAPAGGYVLDPDVETVAVTCDTTASATFTNGKEGCTGCLKICKYEDKNGNGQKDCGEPYLSGWTFNVTGPGYSELVTTGDGCGTCDYECDHCVTIWDLVAGEYTVTEVTPLPDGWMNTDPGDGTYTKIVYVDCYEDDGCCDGGCGLSAFCGGGDCTPECPTVVEFGNQRECTGCLKICKFEDKDGDGQKDYGEPYLSGWTFNVTGLGYSNLVTTSGGGGTCCSGCDYCVTICDLVPGEYTITEVNLPDGWTCTTGNPRTVMVVCDRTTTVKFGNQGPCSGCLKIYKYDDKNGNGVRDSSWRNYEPYLSGWTFNVTDSHGNSWSGTTNRYGYVTICDLPAGETYTITEIQKGGWINTDPGDGTVDVTVSCGRKTTVKFGNQRQLED